MPYWPSLAGSLPGSQCAELADGGVLRRDRLVKALLLALCPLLVCIAATAGTAVPLLLGARWQAAAPMVSWLAIATLLSPFSLASFWLFVSQGRTREQLPYMAGKTAFTLLAVLLGVQGGALGVTRMLAIMSLPIHGTVLWGALRAGPVRPRHLWPSLLPVAAGVAAAMAVTALPLLHPATTPIKIINLSLDLLLAYASSFGVFLVFPGQLRASLRRKMPSFASALRVGRA